MAVSSVARVAGNDPGRGRILPVVRWLQVGAVAAGMGVALATASAALADDGTAAAVGDTATGPQRSAASAPAAQRSGAGPRANVAQSIRRGAIAEDAVADSPRASAAVAARVRASSVIAPTDSDLSPAVPQSVADKAAVAVAPASSPSTTVAAANTTAASGNVLDQFAAFFGLPGAPATAAPTISALPSLVNLTVDDWFGGSVPGPIDNPAFVVNGLFRQILRRDADLTTDELENYLRIYGLTGINGVVAGLYSSTEFRQTQVNNYYLELLGQNLKAPDATPQQTTALDWGTSLLVWGLPEPMLAASIAGSPEFYRSSSAQGGPDGIMPSATTFVNLLYRSLLGRTADPVDAPIYIQQVQAGIPDRLTAVQFVTDNAFREVKIGEIYSVLGLDLNASQISEDLRNWYWKGGLAGIATVLLASAENIDGIEATGAPLPDMVSAAQLQELLLTPYGPVSGTDYAGYFTEDLVAAINANPALLELIRTGGAARGMPNSSLTVTAMTRDVKSMIPTQNEIDLEKSLGRPLTDPVVLELYFRGGIINPPTGVGGSTSAAVLSSNNGIYIIDGHHRWSSIFMINPNAQVTEVDMNYVPNPQTGLKEAQLAIAAQLGTLKTSVVTGQNLLTIEEIPFYVAVADLIVGTYVAGVAAEAYYCPTCAGAGEPDAATLYAEGVRAQVNQPLVGGIFAQALGLKPTAGVTPVEQLALYLPDIQAYLWGNVQLMQKNNQPVTGASVRGVMPQAEPIDPILAYMNGGTLSYSFPIVSYLG